MRRGDHRRRGLPGEPVAARQHGTRHMFGSSGSAVTESRARFDNYYIENWSLWLDVKVVLRTVSEVFRAGGR
ncbi:MAG TPA: sugar transferase [Micromonosporaceae bacterium]|nr:sugar transferase [Micromonosporaceae bacterium]